VTRILFKDQNLFDKFICMCAYMLHACIVYAFVSKLMVVVMLIIQVH